MRMRELDVGEDVRIDIDTVVKGLPPGTSCIATGSIIEGFGNRNSDIDLYVIYEDGKPAQSISIGMRKLRYVDCEHMTLAQLTHLRDTIVDLPWTAVPALRTGDVDRFYRLSIGLPVTTLPATAALLDDYRYDQAAAAVHKLAVWNAYVDLARATVHQALGLEFDAALLVRQAARWQARAELATAGEAYLNRKWLGEQAARRYGRDSARFRELIDPCVRAAGDVDGQLNRMRDRLTLPPEPVSMFQIEACRLADGVRSMHQPDRHHLVKGRSIAAVDGLASLLCQRLASPAGWEQATEQLGAELGVPVDEVRVASWLALAQLRADKFVVTASEEG